MSEKLTPLEAPFSDDVAAILEQYPQRDGYLLKLFRLFANSTRFLTKGVPNLLDKESPLSMREREIVILRVTANLTCEYEWGVHVTAFAAHVGLDETQVAATKTAEPTAGCWSSDEQLLLTAIDELCAGGRIEPATYARVSEVWSKEQQLEIFALAGAYHTVSFVANSTALEGEPFGATFPGGGAS